MTQIKVQYELSLWTKKWDKIIQSINLINKNINISVTFFSRQQLINPSGDTLIMASEHVYMCTRCVNKRLHEHINP